ncbi:MAG: glycosyltransferase [Myxococcales bacterium]|nr:glycosyltransferase [Myxococcales bacterium]
MEARGPRTLIFVPTYNERENVVLLVSAIRDLALDVDVLLLDDNSPDGTGEVIERLSEDDPRIYTIHRKGKLGVGSAHKVGIGWAYERGYERLITMDSDFAHPPEYLPRLIEAADGYDVVVGSRYLREHSLDDWQLHRRILTQVGHFLTVTLLGMPYDATGAFRLYRLTRIPRELFELVASDSYSFFFESLHLVHYNGFDVGEVPIHVQGRTFGTSKMRTTDVATSVRLLMEVFAARVLWPRRLRLPEDRTTVSCPAPAAAPPAVEVDAARPG